MKWATSGLISYLENANSSTPLLMADLYTIEMPSGTVYNWTDADTNLTFNGTTYTASVDQGGQPLIKRGEVTIKRGTDPSTLDLTLYTMDTGQVLGINGPLAGQNGAFDLAKVLIRRVVMPTWGDCATLGGFILFQGLVASADIYSTYLILHLSSNLQLLTVQMPRTLFIPACANSFGDSACGVNLGLYTTSGEVTSGSTALLVNGAVSQGNNYYQNGTLTFTSGTNTGAMAAIASSSGGSLTLSTPLPSIPNAGDTFTVVPGCAKTVSACRNWHGGDKGYFRGCPYVPAAETAASV